MGKGERGGRERERERDRERNNREMTVEYADDSLGSCNARKQCHNDHQYKPAHGQVLEELLDTANVTSRSEHHTGNQNKQSKGTY